jgi:CheY-like chemotaxis protein
VGVYVSALKLLVVDYDPASLELITTVFTSLKAEVRAVNDSQEAANLVNHERFDGIFLDIQMPKLNGFELGKIIRDSSWNKSTPIVIVTSRDQRDTMHQSFSAGATFFLQKPLDRQKLTSLLRTVQGPLLDNRRRYTRVPMQTGLTCSVGLRTLQGITWNLSQGGMQVEVEGLAASDIPTLTFRLPATATVIESEASVVWAKGERQGIHFTGMNVQNQELIRNFIVKSELSPK